MILITRKYLLTLARDDNRNPLASSFPAFSFRWFPMAKMYSKTATNFWLDCSCLLAWIFWIIIWNTQTCPQTDWKCGRSVVSVPSLCQPSLSPPEVNPQPKDISLSKPLRDFQQEPAQTPPRPSCAGTVTPKGVTSFLAARTASASCVLLFGCPNFRDQGKQSLQLHPSPPSLLFTPAQCCYQNS